MLAGGMRFILRIIHFIEFFILAVFCLGCNPSDRSTVLVTWTVITTPTQSATVIPDATTLPIKKSITPTVIVQSAETKPKIQFNSWEIVHDLAYSPDGLLLAISAGDKVRIYDATSLDEKLDIPVGSWTNRLSFHPFLPLIVLAVRDGTIQFWNASTGDLVCQFTSHEKGSNSLSIHPDGKILATTGTDITSRLWDISSLEDGACNIREIGSFIGESFSSPDVAFAPDGKSIALVDLSNIRLRDSNDRKLIALLESDLPIFDIAFSPDGRWLAAAQHKGTVTLWDLTQPKNPTSIKFLIYDENSKIHLWRVAFSPDSSMLAAGASDGTLTIWDISSKKVIDSFHVPSAVTALSFARDGKSITAGGLVAEVWVFPVDPK